MMKMKKKKKKEATSSKSETNRNKRKRKADFITESQKQISPKKTRNLTLIEKVSFGTHHK